MALAQSDFKTQLRLTIGQGTNLDTELDALIRRAARWIEQNWTFFYMEQFAETTLDTTATNPRLINVPSTRLKAVQMVRILQDSGEYHYLRQVRPDQVTANNEAIANGYWQQGVSFLMLDNTPDENYTLEMIYSEYTAWSTDDAYTHWLLDNAEEVFEATIMMRTAFRLRDPKKWQMYKATRDEALKSLISADQAARAGNLEESLQYPGQTGYLQHNMGEA